MDPKVWGKLLTHHRRGYGVDVEALHDRFPSGGVPEKAPRWDLTGTEGCDGGNCVSLAPWLFSGYVGLYRRKKYVGGRPRGPRDMGARPIGAAPSYLMEASAASWLALQVLWITFVPKITLQRFHSLWTPFDIPFLRNTEIGKKTTIWAGPPVSRLVPKMI